MAKVYAVIDMTFGYYQVPLLEEYRDLTTFIQPCGRFRYCVIPIGLQPSSEIFNYCTDPCTANVDNSHMQMDVVLVEDIRTTISEARQGLMKKLRKLFGNLQHPRQRRKQSPCWALYGNSTPGWARPQQDSQHQMCFRSRQSECLDYHQSRRK